MSANTTGALLPRSTVSPGLRPLRTVRLKSPSGPSQSLGSLTSKVVTTPQGSPPLVVLWSMTLSHACGTRAPSTSALGGCSGAEVPTTPASVVDALDVTVGPPAFSSYPKPRSSTGNCSRNVPLTSAHISFTAARRAAPTGLAPRSKSPHCARPTARPSDRTDPANRLPNPGIEGANPAMSDKRVAAAGGKPSAVGILSTW